MIILAVDLAMASVQATMRITGNDHAQSTLPCTAKHKHRHWNFRLWAASRCRSIRSECLLASLRIKMAHGGSTSHHCFCLSSAWTAARRLKATASNGTAKMAFNLASRAGINLAFFRAALLTEKAVAHGQPCEGWHAKNKPCLQTIAKINNCDLRFQLTRQLTKQLFKMLTTTFATIFATTLNILDNFLSKILSKILLLNIFLDSIMLRPFLMSNMSMSHKLKQIKPILDFKDVDVGHLSQVNTKR